MKIILLTLMCLSFTTISIAQISFEDELAQNRGLIMDCAGNLEQIQAKINKIRKKANHQFDIQQSIIDLQQKYLNERKTIIEARDESNMRLDELVYHIDEKESIVKGQSILDLKQQQLTQQQINFTTRILQIEQHIKANYVENINHQSQSHSENIMTYIQELDKIAIAFE